MSSIDIDQVTIQYGQPTRKTYFEISNQNLVGKTIEATGTTFNESAYGEETIFQLFFTDGTTHGIVLPSDE